MNQRLLKNGENINSQNITLFCFPFAGGGASAYNSWVQKMKDTITVCPIQLPGREEQYWNVWLLINNVISHKDSDEYVLNLEIKNVLSDIWYMKLETQSR